MTPARPALKPDPATGPEEPAGPAPDWRRILDLLAARRSCRAFDGSTIDDATLAEIVRDGTEAPSSCNLQNWHFVIVTEPALKRRAQEIAGGNPHFSDAAALIYLTFQKGWSHNNFSVAQSVAAACYHMILSAHLRGFDSIWNAGIGDHGALCEMLALPPSFEVMGALAVGRAKPDAPPMKAPRRPFDQVHSWNRFDRPAVTRYPLRPAARYPYFRITNTENPYAEWDPARWQWAEIADFRGYAVWAKSPLAGVYVSRRQGEATAVELGLLPPLRPGARLVEVMPWGGTYTVALRRALDPGVALHMAELSPHNLAFIAERLRQEGLGEGGVAADLFADGRLPYADASVDAVAFLQTLEHCPDPEAMLDEARRVLRPGGTLLISARNLWSRYGWRWARVESRGQVPNQGPFRPIPAPRLRRWLTARFHVEAELGIGRAAVEDATVSHGAARLVSRLYAARCTRA